MAFDRNDPTDLATLKTELTTDPNGYGYDLTGPTATVTALLNEKRPAITVSKPKISSALIRSTCTYDAYNNLSIDEQEWLRWMTGSNGFDEENVTVTADLRQNLTGDPTANQSIWAVGDRTELNPAMLALIDVEGSRFEQLFGFASSASDADVIAARDS